MTSSSSSTQSPSPNKKSRQQQQPPPQPTNNNDQPLHISPPTTNELETIVWLFPKEQGWNPGIEAFGKGGYSQVIPKEHILVGKMDGEIVCCIACPRFGNNFGWIGLYIVREEKMRGLGLGIQMWKAAMEGPLQGCVTIGLDGVLAQQPNYRKSGFIHNPWNIIRHSGTIKQILSVLTKSVTTTSSTTHHILPTTDNNDFIIQQCIQYDKQIFPDVDRGEFLHRWLVLEKSFAICTRNSEHNQITGFGLIRPAVDGYRIGPLYCNDETIAKQILHELLQHVLLKESSNDQTKIYIDMPECHALFAATINLEAGFTCGRMYWGKPMKEKIEHEFGIVCWEMTF
jgi:hypothetical protein